MIALFLSAFVSLFVVIDPPGCAPIFASLVKDADARHRRAMAIRSTVVASVILLTFALLGQKLLDTLGVSLDAFRIAGGIMLFLIALEMVFEKRTQRRENRVAEASREPAREDISIFPMGIPMIAGPGSIATMMLLMARSQNLGENLVVLAALATVMLLMLASLLAASAIMRVFGPKLEAMITRVLGVILAALATQFVIDGLRASFA
ncbi:MAG: MarC family protein [Sphingomonadaceae bacterium]